MVAGDLSVRARAAECEQMIVKFIDNFCRDDGVDDLRGTMFENETQLEKLRQCTQDNCHSSPARRSYHILLSHTF